MTSQSENDTQTSNNPNVQKPELKEATKPDNSRAGKPPLSQRESKGKANSGVMRFIVLGCAFVCCVFIGVILFVAMNYEKLVAPVLEVANDYASLEPEFVVGGEEPDPKVVEDYANAQVGDRFYFGRYPQGANGEVKPIIWRVLKRNDSTLLVISEKGLAPKPYNDYNDHSIGAEDTTWSECTLRGWLNKEFINEAFNDLERSLIKTSQIKNNAGPSTKDRIFLLSVDEAKSLFLNDKDRIAKCTDYAAKHYACRYVVPGHSNIRTIYTGGTSWWLRSRGEYSFSATQVIFSGHLVSCDDHANYVSIRPALRLTLK